MKLCSHEELEETEFLWFLQARVMNVPLSGPVIIGKATDIAQLMNIDFVPTPSWLEKFKQRRGITFCIISEEAAPAPKEEAQHWASDALQKILVSYTPADIQCRREGAFLPVPSR